MNASPTLAHVLSELEDPDRVNNYPDTYSLELSLEELTPAELALVADVAPDRLYVWRMVQVHFFNKPDGCINVERPEEMFPPFGAALRYSADPTHFCVSVPHASPLKFQELMAGRSEYLDFPNRDRRGRPRNHLRWTLLPPKQPQALLFPCVV